MGGFDRLPILPNGLLQEDASGVTRVLDKERWAKAEERTAELIDCIQPTWKSEERRNAVANYVQRLIMKCFACRVLTFGSVPLKTYLPDGDIDLTALSENESLKDTWATKVRDILESEERSANAEFRVKEVQYIQAEVKIIKCLVENIVVDISFNQIGGLCTLCFLDEIDHLISQSHLFKRSIILIKAWCYYEARILGAHHGLISTYALETLVLYIFHVFNNSFAGPLEVLYRFLEFFSNFDWDRFGVSLWGPFPLSSLPIITPEAPRKDSGALLLDKLFLHGCTSVYAVFPYGEMQGQPFQLKHFNVIDPLRTNNNLGRSVSKGNFFRIRFALSFGAKSLSRLLNCPKENLITEFNQFFKNTWERHGSGHRPDARNPHLLHSVPMINVPVEEAKISRSFAAIKIKSENAGSQVGHEQQQDSDQLERNNLQQSGNKYKVNYLKPASRSQSLKSHGNRVNLKGSDQFETNHSFPGPNQVNKVLPSDYLVNDHERKVRFQFVRTQSSPELTQSCTDGFLQGTRGRAAETRANHNAQTNLDNGDRRNGLGSEVSPGPTVGPFDDPTSFSHGPSYHRLIPVDQNSLSKNYHPDYRVKGEDPTSVSRSLDMHQEAQDLVNMMASSRIHKFNEPVQLPMQLASPLVPLPFSHALTSTGYTQRNLAGLVSTNISSVEPSWESGMQFTQTFASSPLCHYVPSAGLNSNHDHMIDYVSESSVMAEINPLVEDHGMWHAHDSGSTTGVDPDNISFQMIGSNDIQPSDIFNYIPGSRSCDSGPSVLRGQHNYVSENRVPVIYDCTAAVQQQTNRETFTNSNDLNTNLRSLPVSHSSSRTQSSSGSSRDGSSPKAFKPVRDNCGTKPASSAVMTSMYGKENSGRQFRGSAEEFSGQEDDRDWVSLSTMNTDMTGTVIGSASLPSTHVRSHHISGYESYDPSHITEPGSTIPVPPVLFGKSFPRVLDNSGILPRSLCPTGPPAPYFAMLPVHNFPSDIANSDGSRSQINQDEREDQSHINLAGNYFESTENYVQPGVHLSSTSSMNVAPEPFSELKPDILNSDFGSHWQNLQFGRLCQNPHNHGQLTYPSPVMVPPVYLQGNYSWNGPGRPPQLMGYGPRLIPAMPLQPGLSRPSGGFQGYGDDVPPRFRGGTGTFIPNTKANFRDRQYSNTRTHRGNCNYDRNEHSDREPSWISSKLRASGRGRGRNHAEKTSSKIDRSFGTENRADRLWDSYRREAISPNEAQSISYGSSNSIYSSANMGYSMYPLPAVSSNGVSLTGPVMLYPYDQGTGYTSLAEQLNFGSLVPTHPSGMSETQTEDGNSVREI